MKAVAFPLLAFGMWTILGVMSETFNLCDLALQCTTGSPGPLPWGWGMGLAFFGLAAFFMAYTIIIVVAMMRNQLDAFTVRKKVAGSGTSSASGVLDTQDK